MKVNVLSHLEREGRKQQQQQQQNETKKKADSARGAESGGSKDRFRVTVSIHHC